MSGYTNNNIEIAVPTGSIYSYTGKSAPNQWLLCDGATVSITTYANLFSVIGYNYGGSGATFNLPNLRNKVIRGRDTTNSISGTTTGNDSLSLTTTNLPSHNHTMEHNHSNNHKHSISHIHGITSHTHIYADAAFATYAPASNTYAVPYGHDFNDSDNGFYWRNESGGLQTTPANIETGWGGGISSLAQLNSGSATGTGNSSAPSTDTTNATGSGSVSTFQIIPSNLQMNFIIKI